MPVRPVFTSTDLSKATHLDQTTDSPFPPPRPALSLSGSVGLHLLILAALFLAWSGGDAGTIPNEVRHVGLVLDAPLPDRSRFAVAEIERRDSVDQQSATPPAAQVTAASGDAASEADTTGAAGAAASMPKLTDAIDLDGVLAQLTDVGDVGRDAAKTLGLAGQADFGDGRSVGDLGDDELVPGRTRVGGGAGQTTIELFGVSGSGSTFVYVFDRSQSMTGSALRRAKSELISSLRSLTANQQFQIIFYNDEARPFSVGGSPVGLFLGEPATIQRAIKYVQSVSAVGSTDHAPALRMALRLAPDVIFFLTDARIQTMSQAQLNDITRRASGAGTIIHAIQFGSGPQPADPFITELARRNNGDYQYLDVLSF